MTEKVRITQKQLLSRLLYTNPVCLLTSSGVVDPVTNTIKRNVMTISWLTPIDNNAHFICSMNKKRFSATLVNNTLRFVLNIPVKGMEKTVTTIGGCSGYEVDKWQQLANLITPCDIGWNPLTNNEPNIGIDQCAAHLRCVVNKIDPDSNGGHNLLHCTIEEAFVKKEYWDGKNFAPTNANVPPYLTFFGSQRFGYVTTDE